jgi:NADPH-dependent 2,4-dienoyl-CoA reductase/sulfur reductase-like enzyme
MIAAYPTTESSVDGVQRFPDNGINAVIIGGGVGGLQAALECWRKGCDVIVLEQAKKLSPLGMSEDG